MGKICFPTDTAFWKIPFHRYGKARTQPSTTKWFLEKKKKNSFQRGRVKSYHPWKPRLAELGGAWLVSFFSSLMHNTNTSHQGAWSTAETRAGRQEDAHVLGNLLVNPHLLRPYLYTPKINPKAHSQARQGQIWHQWRHSGTTGSQTIPKEIRDNKKKDPSPFLVHV